MATRRSSPLGHKGIPYVNDSIPASARAHLPTKWNDRLTQSRISAFTQAAQQDPETRFVVLGVLRAHTVNGSELPIASLALIVSLLTAVAAAAEALAPDLAWLAWALALGALGITGYAFSWIAAAHVRMQLATVWLGAYTDALHAVERAEELAARTPQPARRLSWLKRWARA